ncbi:MAG: hypothetical protein P9F19_14065 [Candidatus Contendobacter sp.]|nr:hypothetical protein [Candidatus Contendobacter sp.]MDG4558498.1 hypothetical protein [Candidatus Contendobacter sp.]
MSLFILLGALLGPVTPVLAHAVSPIPTSFVLDGSIQEWIKKPPTLSLIPKGIGARPGRIWLAQASKGLVIAGNVDGAPPKFAKSPEDMPNGDHVEIWIAIADRVVLPPIGTYSSLYGIEELHGPADCANGYDEEGCKIWFASQEAHRRLLPRLFVRQWQLAPGVAVETYAQPALERMRKEEHEIYQYLSPKGLPEIRFAARSAKGYSFEALIPWEALPPSDCLNLDELRVMVDIFSKGYQGKYSGLSGFCRGNQI